MRKAIDLVGESYGNLTVVSRGLNTPHNKATWNCICSCGNEHNSTAANLKQGKSKSCGCIRSNRAAQLNTTHGDSNSKEFRSWTAMKNRCLNKNYKRYKDHGGRGIAIYCEWIISYTSFLSYVGRAPSNSHSIDRIKNDGNYEPGNVKWSTPVEQANNRRSKKLVVNYN